MAKEKESERKGYVKISFEGLEKEKEESKGFRLPIFKALTILHGFHKTREKLPIEAFRSLFSSEKARIMKAIAEKEPISIYELAKYLKRDFKAVRNDLAVLERFGFVKLVESKVKGKKRLKPVIALKKIEVSFDL